MLPQIGGGRRRHRHPKDSVQDLVRGAHKQAVRLRKQAHEASMTSAYLSGVRKKGTRKKPKKSLGRRPRWTPQDDRAVARARQRDYEMHEATSAARSVFAKMKKERRTQFQTLSPIPTISANPATDLFPPAPISPNSRTLTPMATPPHELPDFNVLECYRHERIPNRIRMPTGA